MASDYAPTDVAQDWDPLPDQYRWAFGTIKGGPTGFFDSAKTKALQLLGSRRTPSYYLTPAKRDAKGRVVGAMSAAIPVSVPASVPAASKITTPPPTAAKTRPAGAVAAPAPAGTAAKPPPQPSTSPTAAQTRPAPAGAPTTLAKNIPAFTPPVFDFRLNQLRIAADKKKDAEELNKMYEKREIDKAKKEKKEYDALTPEQKTVFDVKQKELEAKRKAESHVEDVSKCPKVDRQDRKDIIPTGRVETAYMLRTNGGIRYKFYISRYSCDGSYYAVMRGKKSGNSFADATDCYALKVYPGNPDDRVEMVSWETVSEDFEEPKLCMCVKYFHFANSFAKVPNPPANDKCAAILRELGQYVHYETGLIRGRADTYFKIFGKGWVPGTIPQIPCRDSSTSSLIYGGKYRFLRGENMILKEYMFNKDHHDSFSSREEGRNGGFFLAAGDVYMVLHTDTGVIWKFVALYQTTNAEEVITPERLRYPIDEQYKGYVSIDSLNIPGPPPPPGVPILPLAYTAGTVAITREAFFKIADKLIEFNGRFAKFTINENLKYPEIQHLLVGLASLKSVTETTATSPTTDLQWIPPKNNSGENPPPFLPSHMHTHAPPSKDIGAIIAVSQLLRIELVPNLITWFEQYAIEVKTVLLGTVVYLVTVYYEALSSETGEFSYLAESSYYKLTPIIDDGFILQPQPIAYTYILFKEKNGLSLLNMFQTNINVLSRTSLNMFKVASFGHLLSTYTTYAKNETFSTKINELWEKSRTVK